jgi:hypothetical protein
VIFTFKKTATVLFGTFPGSGFISKRLGGSVVFVMPGPYAPGAIVEAELSELRRSRDVFGSVNRKVTVPLGSAATGPPPCPRTRAAIAPDEPTSAPKPSPQARRCPRLTE